MPKMLVVLRSKAPSVSFPLLRVRLLRLSGPCKAVPLGFSNVRSSRTVTVDGRLRPPGVIPARVIDEYGLLVFSIRFDAVPAIGFFKVRRLFPRLKLPVVNLRTPSSARLPPSVTPPVRSMVRLFKSESPEGRLMAAVPSKTRFELAVPVNCPAVTDRLPLRVSVWLPMAKFPVVSVRSSIVRSKPSVTPSDTLFTVTFVV